MKFKSHIFYKESIAKYLNDNGLGFVMFNVPSRNPHELYITTQENSPCCQIGQCNIQGKTWKEIWVKLNEARPTLNSIKHEPMHCKFNF